MNVKILLFPLALVVVVWLAIWQIAPSYSTMNQQKDLLNRSDQKLAEAQEKNKKADKLVESFNNATEDQKVIFNYLPKEKKEDEIINTIDTIAFTEGVALYNFSITDAARNSSADLPVNIPGTSYLPTSSAAPQTSMDENGIPTASPIPGAESPIVYPSANETNVGLEFVTNYEKLKSFLTKISNLKRFNKVNSLKISKATMAEGKTDPNSLQIDLNLNFNYLLLSSSRSILNEMTFQVKDFDNEAISAIKNKLNTDIIPVNIGQKGKTNPFLP